MNYRNPVQIGDKVSVAAMGTRGDKRGWEVLPPPNTQHRSKLVASKAGNTLLSSIVLMVIGHPLPIGIFYPAERFSEKNGLLRSNGYVVF